MRTPSECVGEIVERALKEHDMEVEGLRHILLDVLNFFEAEIRRTIGGPYEDSWECDGQRRTVRFSTFDEWLAHQRFKCRDTQTLKALEKMEREVKSKQACLMDTNEVPHLFPNPNLVTVNGVTKEVRKGPFDAEDTEVRGASGQDVQGG